MVIDNPPSLPDAEQHNCSDSSESELGNMQQGSGEVQGDFNGGADELADAQAESESPAQPVCVSVMLSLLVY
jgi:hypothetical protein